MYLYLINSKNHKYSYLMEWTFLWNFVYFEFIWKIMTFTVDNFLEIHFTGKHFQKWMPSNPTSRLLFSFLFTSSPKNTILFFDENMDKSTKTKYILKFKKLNTFTSTSNWIPSYLVLKGFNSINVTNPLFFFKRWWIKNTTGQKNYPDMYLLFMDQHNNSNPYPT